MLATIQIILQPFSANHPQNFLKKVKRNGTLPTTKKKESTPFNQRLFLHPEHYPGDTSRRSMQDSRKKTCGTMPQDLLNFKALTVAYYRPENVRDVLIPSKLKNCEKSIYKVSSHIKNATLEHCINETNYNELRQQDIDKEKDKLASEMRRLNKLTKQVSNEIVIYNPYTKKYCWQHLH